MQWYHFQAFKQLRKLSLTLLIFGSIFVFLELSENFGKKLGQKFRKTVTGFSSQQRINLNFNEREKISLLAKKNSLKRRDYLLQDQNFEKGKSLLNSVVTKNSKFELIAEGLKPFKQFKPKAIQDLRVAANFRRFAWYTNQAYCSSQSELVHFSDSIQGKMEVTINGRVMYFRAPEIYQNRDLFSYSRVNRLEIYPGITGPLKGKVKVDASFFEIYKEAEDAIIKHSSNDKQANLYNHQIVNFTGHRLAGVIALFSALKFKRLNPKTNVNVFTWGSPRMGNRSFAQYMDTIDRLTIFRFTLYDDMIPRHPPRKENYMHSETEYWIGRLDCDCDEKTQTYMCKGIVNEFGVLMEENKLCLNDQNPRYKHDYTHDGTYFGIIFKDCPKLEPNKYQ
ncbi:hypothetical protein G9A89_019155 [Geosiphon pyriformis]|nr:hypothetical protein G9A89_019155 [Geosiphon pyriformis]